MKNECMGCTERDPWCHATCESYAKYRLKLMRYKHLREKKRKELGYDVLPSDR